MTGTNYADLIYSKNSDVFPEIEKVIDENPVSSLTHFLKLYHLKKSGDPGFEKYAKKAVLYFNNPSWIQFQLSKNEEESVESNLPAERNETGHFAVLLPEQMDAYHTPVEIEEPQIAQETIPEEKPEDETPENIQETEVSEDVITDEETDKNYFIEDNEILPELSEQNSDLLTNDETEVQNLEEQEILETENFPNETILENNSALNQDEQIDLGEKAKTLEDNSEKQEEVAFAPGEVVLEDDKLLNEAPLETRTEEISSLEPENTTEEKTSASESEDTRSHNNDEEVAFEPLHTVDYFASQGIRISPEIMNDKLGKQMRSFTDWLKSMKKLHPGKLPEQNEVIEKIIQSSAEESNADAEVLTEAMAEVLIKQNKHEKAIEMYEKLSLMNPSKSAYFAAKIESIKTT